MFDVVGGDGASDDVAQPGVSCRGQRGGEGEEVSLCRRFQTPTITHTIKEENCFLSFFSFILSFSIFILLFISDFFALFLIKTSCH